ncbi:hypothetical protein [Catelliglobosispora koreensis]|uniref:hypothetical protein n=1 Tax=Catelliglobosispora koreensis TaxID=129052 RepID=UPI0012FA5FAD|nr:hypothetical protein [Catelliglobosispora koreensis]
MAAFDREKDRNRPDFFLLTQSPIARVHSAETLAEVTGWLREERYHLIEVEASWLISVHMIRDLSGMSWNDCPGDECWQCLSGSVAGILWDTPADATGVVLVLRNFGVYAEHRYDDAMTLLSIIADSAWSALTRGRRALCIAHIEDRSIPLRRSGWLNAGNVEWAWQGHKAQQQNADGLQLL